jgi:hypothetical protein
VKEHGDRLTIRFSGERIDFLEPGFEAADAGGAPLIEATGTASPN